jgi:hypothetical protein
MLNLTTLVKRGLNILGAASARSINATKALERLSVSLSSFNGGNMLSISGIRP